MANLYLINSGTNSTVQEPLSKHSITHLAPVEGDGIGKSEIDWEGKFFSR